MGLDINIQAQRGGKRMADANTEQEPSIEEILESIRQIISDDDGVVEESVKAEESTSEPAAQPTPEPAPEPVVKKEQPTPPKSIENIAPSAEDDIIDLVEIVDTSHQSDLVLQGEPEEEPDLSDLVLTGETEDVDDSDALLSNNTADAATEAMAKLLAGNVAVERETTVGRVGKVTLEDMARELMRPLIKTWLDQNLPTVIEKIVSKEVEKISRRALDK